MVAHQGAQGARHLDEALEGPQRGMPNEAGRIHDPSRRQSARQVCTENRRGHGENGNNANDGGFCEDRTNRGEHREADDSNKAEVRSDARRQ